MRNISHYEDKKTKKKYTKEQYRTMSWNQKFSVSPVYLVEEDSYVGANYVDDSGSIVSAVIATEILTHQVNNPAPTNDPWTPSYSQQSETIPVHRDPVPEYTRVDSTPYTPVEPTRHPDPSPSYESNSSYSSPSDNSSPSSWDSSSSSSGSGSTDW